MCSSDLRRFSRKRYKAHSCYGTLIGSHIGGGSIRVGSDDLTLSDLERRDARGHFIKRISLITLVPFGLERPNSAR